MALPSGDVTLVFTDIEGSTRLWETHPQVMDAVIDRHSALAREAVVGAGGTVVKDTGDGVFAAFGEAPSAVDAALALQRAIDGEPWPLPEGVRARIGIHRGQVVPVAGDYHGIAANRAARIMSAAWGGQIVVSSDVANGLEGVDLRPLGRHRLKDLSEPIELLQVWAAGLRHTFPPLRSLESGPHNLPAAMTALVGRDDDVVAICGALASSRLVTLTGAGGSGKTRLALQVAAELVGEHDGGAWLVDLAPLSAPEQIAPAAALALGLSERPGAGWERTVIDHVRRRDLVLVLDNCEHLIDAVSRLVDSLLTVAPDVRILATSREPLHVTGEVVRAVPPLPLPPPGATGDDEILASPAVMLFVERATAVRPDHQPADDLEAVVSICSRLDGIPLALELAAARMASLPAREIAGLLDDRFRLLTGGVRTALARQRTLEATVGWSYDLLGDREQAAFVALSVFVGEIELDGATIVLEALGFDRVGTIDALATLVDRSLLTTTTHGYRMLETLRAYGVQRAAELVDLEAVRQAHLRWIRRVAAGAFVDRNDEVAMKRLDRCVDDARAAMEWGRGSGHLDETMTAAAALYTYWTGRALEEGIALLRGLLADADRAPEGTVSPAAVEAVCLSLAGLLVFRGEARPALALTDRAQQLVQPGSWTWLIRFVRGLALPQLGEWEAGAEELLGAVEEARASGSPHTPVVAGSALVAIAFIRGDIDEAARIADDIASMVDERTTSNGAAHVREWQAAICIRRGQLEGARDHLLAVLGHLRAYQPRVCVAHALESSCAWLLATGRPHDAASLSGAAAAIRASYGAPIMWFESAFGIEVEDQLRARLAPEELTAALEEGAGAADADMALERALDLLGQPG